MWGSVAEARQASGPCWFLSPSFDSAMHIQGRDEPSDQNDEVLDR